MENNVAWFQRNFFFKMDRVNVTLTIWPIVTFNLTNLTEKISERESSFIQSLFNTMSTLMH